MLIHDFDRYRLLVLGITIVLGMPPHQHDTRKTKQRLEDAGFELKGRDPGYETGFCFPLLPVRTSIDVDSVMLPNERCEVIHLKHLRRLPNLIRVHSNRALTEAEHRTIQNNVPIGTYLFYDVQTANGETRNLRSFRVGYHRVNQDTNGDGVIDEEDEIKWIRNP